MKLLISVLSLSLIAFSASASAAAATVEKNALIVSAVTNGMFPIAQYEIQAQIPCYAHTTKLVKTKIGFNAYQLGVTYSYNEVKGSMMCMSIKMETFTTNISAEMLPTIHLVGAQEGVKLEFKR